VRLMNHSLRSFAAFVPVGIIRQLMDTGKPLTLSGEARFLSILFTDLENFSTISEHLTPDELMQQVSSYFEVVTSAIAQELGTIDKFIGDSVMAFWGAPAPVDDHVFRACVAAVRASYRMHRLNEQWERDGHSRMNVRIGLHCDNVVVGNVGSPDRLSYTVMGDGVNVASRLEGTNKTFHTTICMSDKVYEQVADRVYARPVQYVTVKGREGRFMAYELIAIRDTADVELVGHERVSELCAMTVAAMERLIAEEPVEAHEKYSEILVSFPNDPVAKHMYETYGVF
jgi:adenylate cyclase